MVMFSTKLPPQSNNANMGIIADNISTLLVAELHNQESGFSWLQAENVDTDTAVGVNSGSRNTWYLGPGLSLSYSQYPLKLWWNFRFGNRRGTTFWYVSAMRSPHQSKWGKNRGEIFLFKFLVEEVTLDLIAGAGGLSVLCLVFWCFGLA